VKGLKAVLIFILPVWCAHAGSIFSSWSSFIEDDDTVPGDLAVVLPNHKLQKLDPGKVSDIKVGDWGSLTFYCSDRRSGGPDSSGTYLLVTHFLLYRPTNQNLTPTGAVQEPELYLVRNEKWREKENGDLRKLPASGGIEHMTFESFILKNRPEDTANAPLLFVTERRTDRRVPWHAFPLNSLFSSAVSISSYLYPNVVNPKDIAARLGLDDNSPFKVEALLLSFKESSEPSTENVLKFDFNRKGADGAFILTGSPASPEYTRQYYIRFSEE
jgi:hypothetical protein